MEAKALAKYRFTVVSEMPRPKAICSKPMPSTYRRMNVALYLSRILSRVSWMYNRVSRTSKSAGDAVEHVETAATSSVIRRRQANRRISWLTTRTATEYTKLLMAETFSMECRLRNTRRKTS